MKIHSQKSSHIYCYLCKNIRPDLISANGTVYAYLKLQTQYFAKLYLPRIKKTFVLFITLSHDVGLLFLTAPSPVTHWAKFIFVNFSLFLVNENKFFKTTKDRYIYLISARFMIMTIPNWLLPIIFTNLSIS